MYYLIYKGVIIIRRINMSKLDAEMFQTDNEVIANVPDGLLHLTKGYLDYAKEVVIDRALPGIDGFKPSQRRILYTMKYIEKIKDNTKCANVAGAVMKLHAHGDASIYSTMTRMVSSAEVMPVAFIDGKGTFGKVYNNDVPAASRYTECRLAPISDELFKEMDGVQFVPSYDGKLNEPVLLPVSFPNVLINPTQGIAIGIASNIPSFNFNEVNDATIELIETGDISKPLVPDFTTKGYYVENEAELNKLMRTGKARFKLRGKWHMEGKTIVIDEIPYYTTVNDIMSDIKDIQGISDIRDESDRNGLRLAIDCSNKKIVDTVLTEVLKNSKLQMSFTSNIVVIIDNKPCIVGITDLLRKWVDFRKAVIDKKLKVDLDKVEYSIMSYEVLVELLSDVALRKQFVDTLMLSEGQARALLSERFKGKEACFDWILGLSLKTISNVDAKVRHLEGLRNTKADIESDLANIDGVIVRELKALNAKYKYPRKTVITDEDYVFEKEDTVVKAVAGPVIVVINDKFIKKLRYNVMTERVDGAIKCMSDDVISFIDNKGRLIRVKLDNIEFMNEYDRGIYLPSYLGTEDDFEVVGYEIISDKEVAYLYNDGFASVIDYSEWCDNQRCTKLTINGISDKANLIIDEIDLTKPYVMLITEQGRMGFVKTDFKHKSRTARTKLVNVKDGDRIVKSKGITYPEMMELVSAPERYVDKLINLSKEDTFNSDYYEELFN